jgi:hypothetical protein
MNYPRLLCVILSQLFLGVAASMSAGASSSTADEKHHNFSVTVYDQNSGVPLELVRVSLERGNQIIRVEPTNPTGKATFREVEAGEYILSARRLGYTEFVDTVLIDEAHATATIRITESALPQQTVEVGGSRESNVSSSVDTRTGNQVLEGETYHAPPTAQATSLIQQNVAGAVRAPTGEVHIRGMHGEYTYYIDDVPVPLGVFGGLNDIVDPKVVDRATFLTGGFPAEYGGQIAAVADMQTRVPSGSFHLDASSYAGSYLTSGENLGDRVGSFKALNANGQSLSFSNHAGDFGFFLSGSRQETDRRIDQPIEPLYHDHGFNYFLYGKGQYLISAQDYLTTNFGYSETQSQIPYDSLEGIQVDDQNTHDAFQTLSFFHNISSGDENESSLFAGFYAREGGLRYDPSVYDDVTQFFGADTTTPYVVAQRRSFTTLGVRTKFDARLSHQFNYSFGFNYSRTAGTENFLFLSQAGEGPQVDDSFNGFDLGFFGQATWHPEEWTAFDFGLRYDQHNAPDIQSENQVSPRIKWNVFLDDFNTVYLYYGRLFIPINIEGLRPLASQIGGSNTGTLSERDNLYEIGYLRKWSFNLSSKITAYYKEASPGLDDQTLGNSSVKTPINLAMVKITGVEVALTYNNPGSPLSGYTNVAFNHAVNNPPSTGGFLPADSSTDPFDADHDQRLSIVAGLNYQRSNYFLNLTGTYGSGLTNGNPNNAAFGTGLFDFNQEAHTSPSWILNVGGGYTIPLGSGHSVEPSLFVTNVLDHAHLLKGAFYSGASFEERRQVMFKIAYHL